MRKSLIFLWSGFWLYLCLLPSIEASTASYAQWAFLGCPGRSHSGCPEWEVFRDLELWIFTTPFLAWALYRYPRVWPAHLDHRFWNRSRPLFSTFTLGILLAVVASALLGAFRAPYEAAQFTQGLAAIPLLLLGSWHRAVLLSAPLPEA